MKVTIISESLSPTSRPVADIHPPRRKRPLPESWVSARERASAMPSDDTECIGDAMDRASAKAEGAIWRRRDLLRGVPCVKNTRIPVYQICGMLSEGYSVRRVAKSLSLSEEEVSEALRFASILLER